MADHLLLGIESRNILATWLRGRERPYQVDPTQWAKLKNGEASSIDFHDLAEIIDNYGPGVLDELLWRGRAKRGVPIER